MFKLNHSYRLKKQHRNTPDLYSMFVADRVDENGNYIDQYGSICVNAVVFQLYKEIEPFEIGYTYTLKDKYKAIYNLSGTDSTTITVIDFDDGVVVNDNVRLNNIAYEDRVFFKRVK